MNERILTVPSDIGYTQDPPCLSGEDDTRGRGTGLVLRRRGHETVDLRGWRHFGELDGVL